MTEQTRSKQVTAEQCDEALAALRPLHRRLVKERTEAYALYRARLLGYPLCIAVADAARAVATQIERWVLARARTQGVPDPVMVAGRVRSRAG